MAGTEELRKGFRLEASRGIFSGDYVLDGTFNGAARYHAKPDPYNPWWILWMPESGEWWVAQSRVMKACTAVSLENRAFTTTSGGIKEIDPKGWRPELPTTYGPYTLAWNG